MAKKEFYSVLLALADSASKSHLTNLLLKQRAVTLQIESINDPYSLVEHCKELVPDLLVVSPVILSDPMVVPFRELLGQESLTIVSYCTTIVEMEMNKHFDAKILATDGENEVVNILESVLEVENEDATEMLLTPREQEVVIAVVKGLTNKEIADTLFLSTHTIITHRRNIARKLNIHSPSGLTIYAIMNKLVTLEEIKEHI